MLGKQGLFGAGVGRTLATGAQESWIFLGLQSIVWCWEPKAQFPNWGPVGGPGEKMGVKDVLHPLEAALS